MGKFDQYKIQLKDFGNTEQVFDYLLDNEYFAKINSPEVQQGTLNAIVKVVKKNTLYNLLISIKGKVLISCDRCLDDMEQPIESEDVIKVKLGDSYSEEGDVVIIPENEGEINVAWFLYELIVLNIPLKHVHPTGECNKEMVGKLKKYLTRQKDDDEEMDDFDEDNTDIDDDNIKTDPRWDGLKNIFDNN